MKTRLMLGVVLLSSLSALAGPPFPGGPGRPGGDEARGERFEARERRARMMMAMAIGEALELGEAETVKLAERLKGLLERRRPLRQQMGEAMRSLRDAAGGDAAAQAQVDANVQRVLDGRAQLAALDKDLFQQLSAGLTPQKKAKLALVLGRLQQEMRGGAGGRRGGPPPDQDD